MDAIQLLKNDHKKVEKIFSDLETKTDDRRALFPELDRELTVHAEIEEKIFYPAAKQAEPTRDLVLDRSKSISRSRWCSPTSSRPTCGRPNGAPTSKCSRKT
jgi:hemerythrin superfamily protein